MSPFVLWLMLLQVGGGMDVITASGTITLSMTQAAESAHLQKIDPNGAERIVVLPASGRETMGLPFVVANVGSGYNLVLKDGSSGGTTVKTLLPGRAALVIVYESGGSYAWSFMDLGGSTAATNSATTGVSTGAAGTGATGATVATNNATALAAAATIVAPAAAATDAVHADYGANSANTWTGTFTNPATARNLTVTFSGSWDGGNVTVTGTDQFDQALSETFTSTPGSTVAGVKVFKTVTGASKTATGTAGQTARIGTGNKLGLTTQMTAPVGVLSVDGTTEAATWDHTYHGVTPTTAPNGSRNYAALYPQNVTIVQGSHTHTGPSHTHSVTDPGHSHA